MPPGSLATDRPRVGSGRPGASTAHEPEDLAGTDINRGRRPRPPEAPSRVGRPGDRGGLRADPCAPHFAQGPPARPFPTGDASRTGEGGPRVPDPDDRRYRAPGPRRRRPPPAGRLPGRPRPATRTTSTRPPPSTASSPSSCRRRGPSSCASWGAALLRRRLRAPVTRVQGPRDRLHRPARRAGPRPRADGALPRTLAPGDAGAGILHAGRRPQPRQPPAMPERRRPAHRPRPRAPHAPRPRRPISPRRPRGIGPRELACPLRPSGPPDDRHRLLSRALDGEQPRAD